MRSCAGNNVAASRRRGSVSLLLVLALVGVALGNCSAWRQSPEESAAEGRAALRAGDYAAAKDRFEAALEARPDMEESRLGLLAALRETGAYEEAEKRADGFLADAESAPLHLERGRIATERGDHAAAEEHLRRALSLGGSVRMDVLRRLGDLLEMTGRRDEARALWEELVGIYQRGLVQGSQALGTIAVAAWRLGYVQDARDIFMDATSESAGEVSLAALSDFGYLFLEKYNATDALGVFRDCLRINKSLPVALLGIALAKKYESSDEVEKHARAALAVNPNLVPARVLLAELRIQEEDYAAAQEQIGKALAVNPRDLDALSLQAVYHHFRGDARQFAGTEQKVLSIHPSYGQFYHVLAENLVMRRKYREAVEHNRRAIGLDPDLWAAHASLGMNLMRVGDLSGGRQALERAFEGDPFNVWAFNTLDLLDQMDTFVRTRTENFVILMSGEDDPVLAPWVTRLAEEVHARLTERYGFRPEGPLQLEVFPDHGGFAVRTLGLPGLGALGVCFGKVIAMDSPRARKPGEFNWGSTLWHEYAHVISLQMSRHNIPRWYSEGISVYEERRARPGWGDDLSAAFLKAYKEGRLLKVSELNAGMMRPKSPEQVGLSYYQASLVCELIEEKFGFDKIRQSLALFAEGKPTDEVFRETLGWDMERLDAEYARYLDSRCSAPAARLDFKRLAEDRGGEKTGDKKHLTSVLERTPDDFFANLQMGALLRKEKAHSAAEVYLKKAQKLFPEFVEPGNPYHQLAEIYLEENREDEALEQFLGWVRYDENAFAPLRRAAEVYRKRKDWASASRVLERFVYIHPYDPEIHAWLGEAAAEAANWDAAIAAYRVQLGLNPTDPADTHYRLARAWLGRGNRAEARKAVLRALEIAPSFAKAQDLLLELSGGKP